MSVLDMSSDKMAEWGQKYIDAVSPLLGEEPMAVGQFQRAGQYFLTIPIIGQLGLILYLAYQSFNKKRAAGLPMNFLLAVTPTKVHAFKFKPGGYGKIRVGDEVASWNRSDIKIVERKDGPMATRITFETNENGQSETITCNAPMLSRNPMSAAVLDLIGGRATS